MWKWLGLAAPVAGLIACAAVASATRQSSDLAGGLGGLFRGTLALSGICAAGAGAAAASILRNERPGWLGIVMVAVNLILMLPGLWVLIRADWD